VIYFDTSFLAPLVLPESTSDGVIALVRELPIGELAVSHWTLVEFSSLIARKVRAGELDAGGAARADARVEATVEESFAVLVPSLGDFVLAKRYLGKFETGLRAPDALHLAIASNRDAAAFYTLDKRLIAAGKILDLPVSAGIGAG
jgi:predicted nucleic acid-binding protein